MGRRRTDRYTVVNCYVWLETVGASLDSGFCDIKEQTTRNAYLLALNQLDLYCRTSTSPVRKSSALRNPTSSHK